MFAQQSQTVTEALWWCLRSSVDNDGLQTCTELRQWQRWIMNGQWQRVP